MDGLEASVVDEETSAGWVGKRGLGELCPEQLSVAGFRLQNNALARLSDSLRPVPEQPARLTGAQPDHKVHIGLAGCQQGIQRRTVDHLCVVDEDDDLLVHHVGQRRGQSNSPDSCRSPGT